jgi:phosphoserine phosphatase
VDWLAQLRGNEIAKQSARLTDRAMNGEIPIEQVYGERLNLIRPTRGEVDALAQVYQDRLADGADSVIASFRRAGIRVVLVSGGFRPAIEPLARALDVELHAVDLYWNDAGEYVGFDSKSPLATQVGKLDVVRQLALPRPTLAVGDGSTDLGMRAAVDEFAAFTGFVRRETVTAAADCEIDSYESLRAMVLNEA